MIASAIPQFVEQELAQDHSGHNHQHAERVVRNAMKIMAEEGGNEKVILTAAWLHDCIDKKLFTDTEQQIGKIVDLLASLQYAQREVHEVLYIIQNISFNGGKNPPLTTLNAKIVRDADRLDAIGAIGIIRTIEYGASKGRCFYETKNIKREEGKCGWNEPSDTSLSHFYEKLLKLESLMHTDTAQRLAHQRTEFLETFLQQFYQELG